MSKADVMFEKIGANKIENCDFCVYEGKINKTDRILFNKVSKGVIFEGFNAITMQELQAINEKCKELRMDGEIEYGRYKSRRLY